MHDSASRVLFITTGLKAGGAEAMLCRLVSSLNRSRFSPEVISLTSGGRVRDEIEAAGIPVHSLDMVSRFPDPRKPLRLVRLIKDIKPALVHGWMYHGNLAASLGKRMSGSTAPVLWGIRQSLDDINDMKRTTALVIKLSAAMSSRPSAIVYCSKVAQRQHEEFGFNSGRAVFIPNGIDTKRFAVDMSHRTHLRCELGLADSSLIVGAVGRSHPQKDYYCYLMAVRIVVDTLRNGFGFPLKFLLVGSGLNTSNQQLQAQIASLDLHNEVVLLGERADVARIIGGLDLLVSSSAFGEAFPNVVAEAMSCAVPCVVTDVGDSALIVDSCGGIVPRRNPEALAFEMLRLLRATPTERQRMGAAARERIVEHYSLQRASSSYEALFERILAEVDSQNTAKNSSTVKRCAA